MENNWPEWHRKQNQNRDVVQRGAPIDQVQVEQEILRLTNDLEAETEAFETLSKDHAVKESDFKKAWYTAYISESGAVKSREAMAGYKTEDMRLEAQVAEALMKAKRERLHSIRSMLDALRTIAANVRVQVQ